MNKQRKSSFFLTPFLVLIASCLTNTALEAATANSRFWSEPEPLLRYGYFKWKNTGTTLRSPRVLEPGELEFSVGAVGTDSTVLSQVTMAAYGVRNGIDVEVRCEDEYLALTPRLQIGKSESVWLDSAVFLEFGYSSAIGFQWGPGLEIGKRWKAIEPYVSYRFRQYVPITLDQRYNQYWRDYFVSSPNLHYVKCGSRFYLPSSWIPTRQQGAKWFIGAEVGPTFIGNDMIYEWAANIGFAY